MPLVGIEPGRRECHDAQRDRMQVDFAYPEATPSPIALEVTSLRDGAYLAGVPASIQLQERLSKIAEREELGSWLATVTAIHRVKDLESDVLELIRRGYPIRPGHYTSDDLMGFSRESERKAFVKMHRRLEAKGLVGLERWRSRREHVVGVFPLSGGRQIVGFSEPLQAAVYDNAPKLGMVEGFERHLAVLVGRFDFSTYPEATAVPELPKVVDAIWVVTRDRLGGAPTGVWHARRGHTSWTVWHDAAEE
jgi:hypothetical protein